MQGMEPLVDQGTNSAATVVVPPRPLQLEILRAADSDIAGIVKLECLRSQPLTPQASQRRKGFIMTKLSVEQLQTLIRNPRDLVIVARYPGTNDIAGAVIAYGRDTALSTYPYLAEHMPQQGCCYVKSLLVSPSQEGRWLSFRLMREFNQWLVSERHSQWLTEACVDPENSVSLAVIKRLGMTEIARIPDTAKQVTWGLYRKTATRE